MMLSNMRVVVLNVRLYRTYNLCTDRTAGQAVTLTLRLPHALRLREFSENVVANWSATDWSTCRWSDYRHCLCILPYQFWGPTCLSFVYRAPRLMIRYMHLTFQLITLRTCIMDVKTSATRTASSATAEIARDAGVGAHSL